ncbi:hypothetical protein KO500_07575 [Cellulophaga baltica]|uniref:DUF6090 family protein n=1 Tax=Cellulophaga TaxID=104264 RepID=UPI001C06BDAA|nr:MULTISPECIES: DUF6090 family protein [Cellulophaga]MBU2996289.1 hypothetical protein [Cellulophaga baltica]MDO6767684.1 DUF6090 family protein [Cellulophaga sp. 1_MG-2023]
MKIFRKNRRNLIRLGKFKTYLVYAFGEIVLIVIGILIAWKINTINEARKNRIVEVKIYNSLYEELNANLHTLDGIIDEYPRTITSLQNTLNFVGLPDEKITKENKLQIANISEREVNLIDGSVNSIISTSKFELLESETLKELITLYPAKITQFNLQDQKIRYIISEKIKPVVEQKLSLVDLLPEHDSIYDNIRKYGQKSNFQALLNDKGYQNAMIDRIVQTEELLSIAKNLRSKTNTLITNLDKEID